MGSTPIIHKREPETLCTIYEMNDVKGRYQHNERSPLHPIQTQIMYIFTNQLGMRMGNYALLVK